jgi:TetR/AcrR family transcriptional regulator, transcriptional repressor for nem operon
MPRVSKAQTDDNRRAITEGAARLFRERGIAGVSVAELMGAAGLTHGGFYGHFESKDALAAEACAHAFEQVVGRWKKRIAAQPDRPAQLKAVVDGYLSTQNRNRPGAACPTAALIGDVARQPAEAPVRAAFAAGVQELLDILVSLQASGDAAADRQQAMRQLSTMVGAMLLSRATMGEALSDEWLAAAREIPPVPRTRKPPR